MEFLTNGFDLNLEKGLARGNDYEVGCIPIGIWLKDTKSVKDETVQNGSLSELRLLMAGEFGNEVVTVHTL